MECCNAGCNDQKVEPLLTSVVSAVKYNERKDILFGDLSSRNTNKRKYGEWTVNSVSYERRAVKKMWCDFKCRNQYAVRTMHVMQCDTSHRWERKSPTSIQNRLQKKNFQQIICSRTTVLKIFVSSETKKHSLHIFESMHEPRYLFWPKTHISNLASMKQWPFLFFCFFKKSHHNLF